MGVIKRILHYLFGKDEYIIFAGNDNYPQGGYLDYKARGTLSECRQWFYENADQIDDGWHIGVWAHIVNPRTGKIVEHMEKAAQCDDNISDARK